MGRLKQGQGSSNQSNRGRQISSLVRHKLDQRRYWWLPPSLFVCAGLFPISSPNIPMLEPRGSVDTHFLGFVGKNTHPKWHFRFKHNRKRKVSLQPTQKEISNEIANFCMRTYEHASREDTSNIRWRRSSSESGFTELNPRKTAAAAEIERFFLP